MPFLWGLYSLAPSLGSQYMYAFLPSLYQGAAGTEVRSRLKVGQEAEAMASLLDCVYPVAAGVAVPSVGLSSSSSSSPSPGGVDQDQRGGEGLNFGDTYSSDTGEFGALLKSAFEQVVADSSRGCGGSGGGGSSHSGSGRSRRVGGGGGGGDDDHGGGSGIGGCGVLVTAPAFARAHRERLCEVLFEEHGAAAVCVMAPEPLELFAAGFVTGCVLSLGHETAAAVPIWEVRCSALLGQLPAQASIATLSLVRFLFVIRYSICWPCIVLGFTPD